MSKTLLVGTRKGLFTLVRHPHGWEISRIDFLGEPVTMLLDDPRDRTLFASLTLGHFGSKLRRQDASATTWEEVATPAYPPGAVVYTNPYIAPDGPPTVPATLKEIWSLETGGPEQAGLLWAGTIPGGLYISRDRGSSWKLIESLWDRPEREHWFGGGKDEAGIHSICVDPRDSQHITLAISCGGVWETRDSGSTWELIGQGQRAGYMPPEMMYNLTAQDPHRLVSSAADPDVMWIQHHSGIFHSTDGGRNFREIEQAGPSTFGFAVCAHPQDPLTAWFVPAVKDETRIPVDAQLVVTRTRDGGQTFETLRHGLPQQHCYDLVFRHGLAVDETGHNLALGSSTGGLWITEDGGDTWQTLSNTLPQIYCVRFRRW